MIYKVGDMIQLGDENHVLSSNLPIGFEGKIVEICEVNSDRYWFYAKYDSPIRHKWYVYHEDCELYMPYDMPDKNELLDFIGI